VEYLLKFLNLNKQVGTRIPITYDLGIKILMTRE